MHEAVCREIKKNPQQRFRPEESRGPFQAISVRHIKVEHLPALISRVRNAPNQRSADQSEAPACPNEQRTIPSAIPSSDASSILPIARPLLANGPSGRSVPRLVAILVALARSAQRPLFPNPEHAPAVLALAVVEVGRPEPAPRDVGGEIRQRVEELGDLGREHVVAAAVRLGALEAGVLDDGVAQAPVVVVRDGVDAGDGVQDGEGEGPVRFFGLEGVEGGGFRFEFLLGELAEGGYVVFVGEDVHVDAE